ncbi:MAG: hypothetical protein QXQ50_01005 [Candidatus Bathyarchaeia archaeon]
MRGYLFTAAERKAIQRYIENRKRNETINKLAYYVNNNWHVLLADFKLMIKFKRLLDAGY